MATPLASGSGNFGVAVGEWEVLHDSMVLPSECARMRAGTDASGGGAGCHAGCLAARAAYLTRCGAGRGPRAARQGGQLTGDGADSRRRLPADGDVRPDAPGFRCDLLRLPRREGDYQRRARDRGVEEGYRADLERAGDGAIPPVVRERTARPTRAHAELWFLPHRRAQFPGQAFHLEIPRQRHQGGVGRPGCGSGGAAGVGGNPLAHRPSGCGRPHGAPGSRSSGIEPRNGCALLH